MLIFQEEVNQQFQSENQSLEPEIILQEEKTIQIIDREKGNRYMYLEGIRGFGAFIVYNHHFTVQCSDYLISRNQNSIVPSWYLRAIFASPINIFLNGQFWVGPFFLLSGFVLTISWYKNRQQYSIIGGIFKRYIRLMLPVLSILSMYYLVGNVGITKDPYFQEEKSLSFQQFLVNVILKVWVGYNKIDDVVWTMQHELFGSFFVLVFAYICIKYRHRWIYYLILISLPIISYDKNPSNLVNFLPLFTLGAAFADLEALNFFQCIKNYRKSIKYLIICLLTVLFLVYATVLPEYVCEIRNKEDCDFFINHVTFNYTIHFQWAQEIGSVSIFLLALISSNFQKFLSTRPFVFLGKISFQFYLIHKIITQWMITDLIKFVVSQQIFSQEKALILLYLFYTPLLMLFSYYLEIYIDTPSRNFSQNLEKYLRIDNDSISIKNNVSNLEEKKDIKDEYNLWQFIKNQQILKTLGIQLVLTFIITEAYRYYRW